MEPHDLIRLPPNLPVPEHDGAAEAEDGSSARIFYPVFPPDRHPREVLTWLHATTTG